MKILMLNYEFPPLGGGAANATSHILKEFSNFNDLNIHLVTSSTGKAKIQEFSHNIAIHYLDIGKKKTALHYQSNTELIRYSFQSFIYSRELVHKTPFDLIHAFFGIPCGFIAMNLNKPYIVSLRGSDVPFYNKRFKKLDTLIFKRLSRKIWANSFKTISNSEKLKTLALQSASNQKIDVIPNGIDSKFFIPSYQKKELKQLHLLSVGRLIERKGFEYLINSVKNLSNVMLTIVGDGPQKKYLQKLSIGFPIHFTGYVPHNRMPEIYKAHDIFILPSLNEGMSNTVLEAMACGLPIIVTRTGGTSELLQEGTNGFVVAKKSTSDLTEKIKIYQGNNELVRKHGENSRKIAEKANWSLVAHQYYELYLEITKSTRRMIK
ncbi:MAG: glycosyltransferase family 4 protein [Desulfobacteraceae bacterium]|nr:MAG: glycosyltransferase family 4 protein [Desulfobacteraceae bacterium]